MQSLLLPAPWFSNTHFGPHRFDIDPGHIPIHSRPPSAGSKSSLGALHIPLPMSGSLPTGTQSEGADVIQYQQQSGPERPTPIDPVRTSLPPRLPTLNPIGTSSVTQPPRFLSPLGTPIHGSSAFQVPGINTGLSQVFTEPPQTYGVPATSTVRPLPPRSTRRAKAHVASACVNCKRKHLGCDSARPCRRCVLSGKASTCVDVTHKKRGRPPLKAEETPLRAFSSVEGAMTSREQYQVGSARGHGHSRTSSREIRPITDLQYVRPQGNNVAGPNVNFESMPPHHQRWQPLTSPQTMPAGRGQPPLASPVAPPFQPPYTGANYPQSPYAPSPVPSFATSATGAEFRPVLAYGDRPPVVTPPTVSPQQYHQPYPPSLPPHVNPQTPNRPGDTVGPSLDIQDPSRDTGFRLPPILPSPTAYAHGSPAHSHKRSGSFPDLAGFQTQVQPQPQESPRSLFDPPTRVDLRSQFPAIARPQSLITGQEQMSPDFQTHQWPDTTGASGTASDRRRKSEADHEENPQPAKRRRMALDDIVND
ncbi:hypothetical protein BGW36DRAFT_357452 [Talaromyces proteolyticus]|uniref:Zn(2)-C6 fungal-type domain-containing protein n=1 Tax=Talaromyces proteolyticus TaxID=1131652 RepID=A0AAD4Q2X7_9EURO|nr:uncharacterized protein BGW36DRAFT_357452 [Talaromyces proteolyticus]KAH8700808.1 hypothetical protein BGW36DRAFT_357452 [Talaromyces proteolyticus]